jgi:hypothetical protein
MGKDVFCECPSLSQSGIKIMPQEPAPQPAIVVRNENKVQRAVKTKPTQVKPELVFWKIIFLVEIILAFLAFGLRRDETKYMRYPMKIFHNVSREMFITINFLPILGAVIFVILSVIKLDVNKFVEGLDYIAVFYFWGVGLALLTLSVPTIMQKLFGIPFLTITEKYIRKGTLWSMVSGRSYIYYDDVVDLRLVRKAFGRDSNIPLSAQLDAGCYSFRLQHWCLRIIRKGKRAEWICLTGLELKPYEIYDIVSRFMPNIVENNNENEEQYVHFSSHSELLRV